MPRDVPIDNHEYHAAFLASPRKHVLMVSNHGIHQWDVVPGLPDTGGQNVFINQFSGALIEAGFKVTIANRGGYPHPVSGDLHSGLRYKDPVERILYLEDGHPHFVRKEKMRAHIPALTAYLRDFIADEGSSIGLMITHYWDAGRLGMLLNKDIPRPIPHIWVPHSLGSMKKKFLSPTEQEQLNLHERIDFEQALIREVNGVAATSLAIRIALQNDYGYVTSLLLPPCIEKERFHPREVPPTDPLWEFLSRSSGLPATEIWGRKIITEISRTDTTKRKDVLLKSFSDLHHRRPETFLVVSIDESEDTISRDLRALIASLGLAPNVAVVGSVPGLLPALYAISSLYCTPSVLEDFGIAVQEAAACGVPAVASSRVPYAVEYLLTNEVDEEESPPLGSAPLRIGAGAIVVEPDDVAGFTRAMEKLIADETLRKKMGERALRITIPYFTWDRMVRLFFSRLGLRID